MELPEFELIYKQWNVSLQKYAHYFLRDEEASRSIVNDLFLYLWFSKKQPDNCKVYLFRPVKTLRSTTSKSMETSLCYM